MPNVSARGCVLGGPKTCPESRRKPQPSIPRGFPPGPIGGTMGHAYQPRGGTRESRPGCDLLTPLFGGVINVFLCTNRTESGSHVSILKAKCCAQNSWFSVPICARVSRYAIRFSPQVVELLAACLHHNTVVHTAPPRNNRAALTAKPPPPSVKKVRKSLASAQGTFSAVRDWDERTFQVRNRGCCIAHT